MDKFNVMVGKWKKWLPEHNYHIIYEFLFKGTDDCIICKNLVRLAEISPLKSHNTHVCSFQMFGDMIHAWLCNVWSMFLPIVLSTQK